MLTVLLIADGRVYSATAFPPKSDGVAKLSIPSFTVTLLPDGASIVQFSPSPASKPSLYSGAARAHSAPVSITAAATAAETSLPISFISNSNPMPSAAS